MCGHRDIRSVVAQVRADALHDVGPARGARLLMLGAAGAADDVPARHEDTVHAVVETDDTLVIIGVVVFIGSSSRGISGWRRRRLVR